MQGLIQDLRYGIRMLLKSPAVTAVAVIMVGLAGSFGLTRVISTLLFDVAATDKMTFAAVSQGLFAITFVAGYIPAWRATRVNPLVALRYE